MIDSIKCAGGTVVKEGEKKWAVYAPDNRPVGTCPTRKQALAKAEHWDKYDALASVQDIAFLMVPFSTTLMRETLASVGKNFKVPSDEQIKQAVIMDTILGILRMLASEGKISTVDTDKTLDDFS